MVKFDKNNKAIGLYEKPKKFVSNYAIPGVYIYDKNVSLYSKLVNKSYRGELEITDLNKIYLKKNSLNVKILSRGVAWLDAGSPEQMLEASEYVRIIEKRQGLKIACLEEISFRNKWISKKELFLNISKLPECDYRDYLESIIN